MVCICFLIGLGFKLIEIRYFFYYLFIFFFVVFGYIVINFRVEIVFFDFRLFEMVVEYIIVL